MDRDPCSEFVWSNLFEKCFDTRSYEHLTELKDSQINQIDDKGLTILTAMAKHDFIGGNKEKFIYLFNLVCFDKINLNEKDSYGDTALIIAAYRGHVDILKVLLGHRDIDINIKHRCHGDTALILAAYHGHKDIVKALLGHRGINVNIKNEDGDTALIIAVNRGHKDIVKALLARKVVHVNFINRDGYTALMLAAECGHEETVKDLLGHRDIDVNIENSDWETALMIATKCGHEDIVEALLRKEGIDVNIQNIVGYTAPMFAVKTGTTRMLKDLLAREDIDVNIKNEDGDTALILAIAVEKAFSRMFSELDIVAEILAHADINVNIKNFNGDTALVVAVYFGCVDTVRDLLENPYIEVNLQNNRGQTALMVAVEFGCLDVVKALLEKEDINVNIADKNGVTPLMLAALNGEIKIFEALLEKFPELKAVDVNGNKLYHYILESGNSKKIFELLEKHLYRVLVDRRKRYIFMCKDMDMFKETVRPVAGDESNNHGKEIVEIMKKKHMPPDKESSHETAYRPFSINTCRRTYHPCKYKEIYPGTLEYEERNCLSNRSRPTRLTFDFSPTGRSSSDSTVRGEEPKSEDVREGEVRRQNMRKK